MNEQIHQNGVRLLALRQKLRAREGKPEYRKNCEDLRKQIAALENATAVQSGERSEPVSSENLTTADEQAK